MCPSSSFLVIRCTRVELEGEAEIYRGGDMSEMLVYFAATISSMFAYILVIFSMGILKARYVR